MIRTSKARNSIREEMSQTESISWTHCLKTTLELRIEQEKSLVSSNVDYVIIPSNNRVEPWEDFLPLWGWEFLFFAEK